MRGNECGWGAFVEGPNSDEYDQTAAGGGGIDEELVCPVQMIYNIAIYNGRNAVGFPPTTAFNSLTRSSTDPEALELMVGR